MIPYSQHFGINKNFQSSINLGLDLNDPAKIIEYIPTTDICDVLKKYLKTFNGLSKDYATTLIGPYGKGKSFLLLVLAYVTGQKKKDDVYKELLVKIKGVDKELYDLIETFNRSKKRLLPVVINSNYDNLQQSFMLALNESLVRDNIEEIVPQTVYDVCLKLLKSWVSNPDLKNKVEVECAKAAKIKISQLRAGLKEYSPESYKIFKKIYNCVSNGLAFNPLVNDDIVKTYGDVNHELIKKGYSGMLIIFDEFSKFIEGSDDSLMKDLKIIQDFAELANRSSNSEQLNLCCITHKSLDLYGNTETKLDSFKTVEGRFKEIKFNRSLEENYQIIAAAIKKINGSQKIISKYKAENKDFYKRIEKSNLFAGKHDLQNVTDGCFPLNPMTVYALIQLSEIVAQNERTLFTFLSDTDDNSFNVFLKNSSTGLFNVDKIYDYFSSLLKKEESNSIRSIWYRAEGTLSRETDDKHRKIVKSLAVILMINDFDRFAPSVENLSLCSEIELPEVKSIIKEMIDNHYLRRNIINNLLSFATTNNKAIEEQIALIERVKKNSFEIERVLEEVDETKYILPRKYNEQHKITRFYRTVYMTESQFENITDLGIIKDQSFCDGLVINLIREKLSKKDISDCLDIKKGSEYTVIRYPDKKINSYFKELLLRYSSIKELLLRGGNDQIITSEVELLLNETTDDIKTLIDEYFSDECDFYASGFNDDDSFTAILSRIMSNLFSKNICFNNELVNKEKLTTQYQKSVNNVMQYLLRGSTKWDYSETSPEGTVFSAVIENLDQKDVVDVICEIRNNIISSGKQRIEVSSITDKYTRKPYGIRKGILQILLVKAISELASDNVILYLDKNEIDLNAENICKSIFSEQKYYIGYSKGSKEQTEYLYKMMKLFNAESSNNYRNDIKILCDELRKFFVGLPQIVRSDKEDSYLGIPSEINNYKNIFMNYNINSFDAIYVKPQEIFDTNNFNEIYRSISAFYTHWIKYIYSYQKGISIEIKNVFSINSKTSLKMGINEYIQATLKDSKPVLSDINNNIYTVCLNLTFDDNRSASELAHASLGSYIEDWNDDRSSEFIEGLENFKNDLSNANMINTSKTSLDEILIRASSTPIGSIGKRMQTTLESTFDEYGDSVSSEEKLAILSKVIKKILK